MRRLGLLLLLLVAVAYPATAQIRASVTMTLDSSGKQPMVKLSRLLDEREWRQAAQQGVAVRVAWTVTQWRKGGLLGDNAMQTVRWTDLIQPQALLGTYDFRRVYPTRAEEPRSYATLDQLNVVEFGAPIPLRLTLPTRSGEYYYSAEVALSTLDGDDLDRITRFQGQNSGALWNWLTRTVGSLFLPGTRLPTVRTPTFRIGG